MSVSKRTAWVITFIAIAIVLLLFVLSTSNLGKYSCEVCMAYGGRSQCRTALGATEQEAVRTATDNACQFLSSGMTEGILCGRTPPLSVTCRPR